MICIPQLQIHCPFKSMNIKFNSQVMCMTLAVMVTQLTGLKLEAVDIYLHVCDYSVLATNHRPIARDTAAGKKLARIAI